MIRCYSWPWSNQKGGSATRWSFCRVAWNSEKGYSLKNCDIANEIDIKEKLVHVAEEMCLISQKRTFNSNSSSKLNTECITELQKKKNQKKSEKII